MKRFVLILLATLLVLGLFALTGYAGYRFGYARGTQSTAGSDIVRPGIRLFDDVGPRGMPGHNFMFGRGSGGFPMMGFGFFSLTAFLGRIAVLALVIWFVYWLLTRSGWRLTRTAAVAEMQSKPAETDPKA